MKRLLSIILSIAYLFIAVGASAGNPCPECNEERTEFCKNEIQLYQIGHTYEAPAPAVISCAADSFTVDGGSVVEGYGRQIFPGEPLYLRYCNLRL